MLVTTPAYCCSFDDIFNPSSSESEDTDVEPDAGTAPDAVEHQPVSLGPAYQGELPQLRQRPASPTAAEAKFLTAPVYTPESRQHQGQQQQQQQQPNPALALPPRLFRAQWLVAGSGTARLQLLRQWLLRADEAMGQGLPEVRAQSQRMLTACKLHHKAELLCVQMT
jgi:hypothetical protein